VTSLAKDGLREVVDDVVREIQQAKPPDDAAVTSRPAGGTPAAERKRQQRDRDRRALLFEREDWQLFLDPPTLGQKAGTQPEYLRQPVLREVVDNARDAGAQATLDRDGAAWMSVVAARMLLDRLAPYIQKVLVLHDFGVSGFSIFGTPGKDGRRDKFPNDVEVIDIGLRLADVDNLGLKPGRYETSGDWDKRSDTLEEHGADQEEIHSLRHLRVELNAMPSDVFIKFIELKLTEHGIQKVMPDADALADHARHVIKRALASEALEKIRDEVEADAAAISLPPDLHWQVTEALKRRPDLPWDLAVAEIAIETMQRGRSA
jgi:hypothetical protein